MAEFFQKKEFSENEKIVEMEKKREKEVTNDLKGEHFEIENSTQKIKRDSRREMGKPMGRMTLKQIRQAYKSKKEKRDKSHNRVDLIQETIQDSKAKTSEVEKMPMVTQSEIQIDTQGNYIVPKRLFEKISETQRQLMATFSPKHSEKRRNYLGSQSKGRKEKEERMTFSEIQNKVEEDLKFVEEKVEREKKKEKVEEPENPFDFQRKRVGNVGRLKEGDFRRKGKGETEREEKGEMFGSQPIVMNNNFVNYNYYINDIRQNNWSQTQKVPPKRKNTGRNEGTRKKTQRVKSEVGRLKKGEFDQMTDEEKLKYFEKYKQKFGVNYKAELNKKKNGRGETAAEKERFYQTA